MVNHAAEPGQLLAGLGMQLKAGQLEIKAGDGALLVAAPDSGGQAFTVTCGPRADDAGTLWFFGDGQPLAEADQPVTAMVAIRGILAGGAGR